MVGRGHNRKSILFFNFHLKYAFRSHGEVKTNAIFKIFDPKNLDNNEAKILSIWTIAQEAMEANMCLPEVIVQNYC